MAIKFASKSPPILAKFLIKSSGQVETAAVAKKSVYHNCQSVAGLYWNAKLNIKLQSFKKKIQ